MAPSVQWTKKSLSVVEATYRCGCQRSPETLPISFILMSTPVSLPLPCNDCELVKSVKGHQAVAVMAAMASLSSTSCLLQPQRLSSSSLRNPISSRATSRLVNSSFNGVRLQVQTGVRNQHLRVSIIRAGGAKGDYLVVSAYLLLVYNFIPVLFLW